MRRCRYGREKPADREVSAGQAGQLYVLVHDNEQADALDIEDCFAPETFPSALGPWHVPPTAGSPGIVSHREAGPFQPCIPRRSFSPSLCVTCPSNT